MTNRITIARRVVTTTLLLLGLSLTANAQTEKTGVLLLAHGGSTEWNDRVKSVAASVDRHEATEVALGMASRASIQAAVDRLKARGVTRITAVPLLVSSYSSVITSTEYLLGLRAEAPADLKLFATMDHDGQGAHGGAAGEGASGDPLQRVDVTVPVRMTAALNRHPLIAQIATDRARSISRSPASEAVLLVAHGPVPEDDNRRWLEDMAQIAAQISAAVPFATVDYLTVRDDADRDMRAAATADLRGRVERQIALGRRVLIVPHLLSYGGIEKGIRERLEGLAYTMTDQALMPDDRIVEWVLASLR